MVRQLLGDTWRSLAVNSQASIAVMVIKVPAKALLACFKTQVGAGGYDAGLWKTFNNCDDTSAPLGGDLPRHFEWRWIYDFVHRQSQPSLLFDLRTK
jgi:hypothetical protein